MDLNAPPPSYEAAISIPVEHPSVNCRVLPTAPPPSQDDDIISSPVSTPILPQPHRLHPHQNRMYNPANPYRVPRPQPQPNNRLRREQPKNDFGACICLFITIILLPVLVVILVVVVKNISAKYNK